MLNKIIPPLVKSSNKEDVTYNRLIFSLKIDKCDQKNVKDTMNDLIKGQIIYLTDSTVSIYVFAMLVMLGNNEIFSTVTFQKFDDYQDEIELIETKERKTFWHFVTLSSLEQ